MQSTQEIYRPVSGHTKLQKAANLQVDKLKSSHIELCHLFGWMKFGKCICVNYCSEMKAGFITRLQIEVEFRKI